MFNIESIILGTFLGTFLTVVGNIIVFEYSGRKQHRKEIKKKLLVNLLLPLYIVLRIDELELQSWIKNENVDLYEYEADMPKRLLKKLDKIIKTNLYLADNELHSACIVFMQWMYGSDSNDRFQRIHTSDLEEDNKFIEFRNFIYKRYENEKKKYL